MDGVTVPLAGYDGDSPGQPAAEVILGVRPEHVDRRAPTATACPAVIDIDEPMGSDSLLWLTVAGQTALGPHHRRPPLPATASRCSVAFDITKASLFDQKTEQRL